MRERARRVAIPILQKLEELHPFKFVEQERSTEAKGESNGVYWSKIGRNMDSLLCLSTVPIHYIKPNAPFHQVKLPEWSDHLALFP